MGRHGVNRERERDRETEREREREREKERECVRAYVCLGIAVRIIHFYTVNCHMYDFRKFHLHV